MNLDDKIKLANSLNQQGEIDKAEKLYLEILNQSNKKYEALLSLGLINIKKKNFDSSIIFFKKAIKINKTDIRAYINVGNIFIILKNFSEAIKYLEKAKKINYKNENVINNLSYLYNEKNNYRLLDININLGLNININNFFLLNLKGKLLINENNIEEGISYYQKSINANDKYKYAYENLLLILERTNKLKEFKNYLDKAKNIFLDDEDILLLEAIYYMRIKNFENVKKILITNNLLEKFKYREDKRIKYFDILAKCQDNLNETKLAYNNFEQRNYIIKNQIKNKIFDKNIIINLINDYKNYFNKENISKFKKSNIAKQILSPVFLIGFPRSGTTLLDSILRSHSNIFVLEEKLLVSKVRDNFFEKNQKKIKSLETLKNEQILSLQQDYLDILKKDNKNIDLSNTLVDKFPLNIIEIGFIKRIFPNSKFILAMRHPCDAILSCFMSDFKINEGMANFYNLEDTALLYDNVFTLWKNYNKVLEIDYCLIKYEDVVNSFEETIKKLIVFLGLKWEHNLFDFNKTALKRQKINTPSYNQVIEPLYVSSIDRWKKYKQIENVYPIMKKWIKEYDY